MPVYVQRPEEDTRCPVSSLRMGCLIETGATLIVIKPINCLSPPLPFIVLGYKHIHGYPWLVFECRFWDLNSDPYVYTASCLTH